MRRHPLLGLSVGQGAVRAILVAGHRIEWIGSTTWSAPDDLVEAIAQLAGEPSRAVRAARVVLERELVQTRTIIPPPPLKPRAARRYVALEAPRLFRRNGVPLVTDGVILHTSQSARALWCAAAPEDVLRAILEGCRQAGIVVERVGPAADVLPKTTAAPTVGELVFPNGRTAEVISVGSAGTWRSRLVLKAEGGAPELMPALRALGPEAIQFAGAYGATTASPRLSLLPPDTIAARARVARRQLIRAVTLAAGLWVIALVTYAARLEITATSAARELKSHRGALDSALALRRDLDAGTQSLAEFAALKALRSRHLMLIAAVTSALDDSVYISTFQVQSDGVVRLAGYGQSALRVVASLGRVSMLDDVRLEGPVTRERPTGGRELDRFAITARVGPP